MARKSQHERVRTISEIWERAELVEAKTAAETDSLRKIKKALKGAVRQDGQGEIIGGNGYTVLKFREPAVSRLVASGRIGGEEMRALDEIDRVYTQLCAASLLRGYEIRERGDRSMPHEPLWFIAAYARYKLWADKWSKRKYLFKDISLEVVFDILFSGKSGKEIDNEGCWKHGFATTLFVNAVRDYAAMAGWVDGATAIKWSADAVSVFPLRRMRRG